MGNSLSPCVAELFMSGFRKDSHPLQYFPRLWVRYVDDIFATSHTKHTSVDAFLS